MRTGGAQSGHRCRIEQHQRVMQFPVLSPSLLATAGNIEHQAKEFPAHFFNRGRAIGDGTRVDIHQVVPATREVAACGDFDYRDCGESVRRAAPGREYVQVHSCGQLQRAADEVARGRRGKGQSFLLQFFARRENTGNRCRFQAETD